MMKIYRYIDNPQVFAIYDKATDTLVISTHPKAIAGIIYIHF